MGNKKGVIIGICGVGVIIISLIIYILFNQNTTVEEPQNIQSTELPIVTEPVLTPETPTQEPYQYIDANGNTLEKRVLTPDGFNRLQAPEGGFANFLRNYELKEDGAPILMYDGRVKSNQESHIAVFNMRISNKDLQQCADSVIRLYAEYFYETEQYDRMQFHFVNGFNCDYPSWQSGKRVSISGNNVNWVSSAGYDNSYDSFEKYLAMVFAYASTLSMDTEASEITLEEMQIHSTLALFALYQFRFNSVSNPY